MGRKKKPAKAPKAKKPKKSEPKKVDKPKAPVKPPVEAKKPEKATRFNDPVGDFVGRVIYVSDKGKSSAFRVDHFVDASGLEFGDLMPQIRAGMTKGCMIILNTKQTMQVCDELAHRTDCKFIRL